MRLLSPITYALPPSNEQAEIADFLNRECKAIDQLVAELKMVSQKGRRPCPKPLGNGAEPIATAVTGKKEVA